MSHPPPPLPAEEAGRILLVVDDVTNLEVLRQTLDGRGYRLFVAPSGEDVLKVARRTRPLLVLLDATQPGIDGYETCRCIKDDPEAGHAAVIFLSSLDDAKDKARAFEAGAVDFITKPFGSDEVVARVNTHMGIQRLLRRQLDARSQAVASAPRPADETPPHGQWPDRARHPGTLSSRTGEPGADRSVFQPGQVVAHRFRIVRYIAKGGMGELYEAEDLELRERVALKTILSAIAEDERSVLLFKREVHLARQVTHPNVCRIFDVYRHRTPRESGAEAPEEEVVFLSMELVDGETLAGRLRRERRLPTADVLHIARQMAAGLGAAHRVGVVHRDFKSDNVMLVPPRPPDQDSRVVITDFGLARRTVQDEGSHLSLSLTDTDEISGTPAYMAPEQVEGGPVTPATDVYALGVVLYEMITGVWPFVGDTPLRIAVKRLQEAAPSPRLLVPDLDARWEATILRCLARQPSDRFASVGDVIAALEGRVAPRAAGRGLKRVALALVATLVAAIGVAAFARLGLFGRAEHGIASLAVLPFGNVGNDPEKEYLSDGISEGLIRHLSRLPGMKVIANTSTLKYKGQQTDPQEVARALGVTGIVIGRVSQRGDDLSISVELIDGRDRTQVWGEQYSRKAADVLAVQAEISREIADQLRIALSDGQREQFATRERANPQAYELFLKGRFHRARGSAEDRRKAGEYFEQAIAVDPAYAPAYADLSDIYRSLVGSSLVGPKEYLPKAVAAAKKALELDPSLADAHYALANLETYAWKWADAERGYRRAIELNPNLALAHRWYANFLVLEGRHEEALVEIRRARELDPLSPGVNATVGYILYFSRRYDQSVEALKKAVELDRNYPYPHFFLGHVHAAQGTYAASIAAYQEAIRLGLDTPVTQIRLGAAYALAGERARALTILERFQGGRGYVSRADLALLFAALGEREKAFAALEEAYAAHDPQLQYLGTSPAFDPLRSDTRFDDLVRRVGLSP